MSLMPRFCKPAGEEGTPEAQFRQPKGVIAVLDVAVTTSMINPTSGNKMGYDGICYFFFTESSRN
jgi:hypothetical protein